MTESKWLMSKKVRLSIVLFVLILAGAYLGQQLLSLEDRKALAIASGSSQRATTPALPGQDTSVMAQTNQQPRKDALAAAGRRSGRPEADRPNTADTLLETGGDGDLEDTIKRVTDLAKTNPAAAAQLAREKLQGVFTLGSLWKTIAYNFANQDLKAAVEWAASLSEQMQSSVLPEVARSWSEKDPSSAADWVAKLPESDQRNESAGVIAENWMKRDREVAIDWVKQLPEETRNYAFVNVVRALVSTDPLRAAKFASAQPDGADRLGALSNLAYHWAKEDPDAAFAFVSELPEHEMGPAIGQIAAGLHEKDPDASVAWVKQLLQQGQWVKTLPEVDRVIILDDLARVLGETDQVVATQLRSLMGQKETLALKDGQTTEVKLKTK